MTLRILPKAEWFKLDATNAKDIWRDFTEGVQFPVVIERAGRLVGHIILMPVLHAECGYIEPEYRNGLAFGRLWQETKRVARDDFKVRSVWATSLEPVMQRLIEHEGGALVAGTHALVSVEE